MKKTINMQSLKTLVGFTGAIGASLFLGLPALAQSAADIELSPEGMEILCERFPLNSRCVGTADTMEQMDNRTEPSVFDESPADEDFNPTDSGIELPDDGDDALTEPGSTDGGLMEERDNRTEPSVLDESPAQDDFAPTDSGPEVETENRIRPGVPENDSEGMLDERTDPSVLDESPARPNY